ncbi:MAG TPA: copper chaperone PCu(A)C [Gammaproteobacteria bacterium]|nr:copper chaperone PCu(A)C [Gammaproteobacteria bacterium]
MKHLPWALAALLFAVSAAANGLTVSAPWVRVMPGDLPCGGYFTLENGSDQDVTLIGASVPDFARAMLHNSVSENGVEKMVPVDRVTVPAHGEIRFQPGGYHVMLMKRRHSLSIGDTVPVTLRFADGRTVEASFKLRGPAAMGAE